MRTMRTVSMNFDVALREFCGNYQSASASAIFQGIRKRRNSLRSIGLLAGCLRWLSLAFALWLPAKSWALDVTVVNGGTVDYYYTGCTISVGGGGCVTQPLTYRWQPFALAPGASYTFLGVVTCIGDSVWINYCDCSGNAVAPSQKAGSAGNLAFTIYPCGKGVVDSKDRGATKEPSCDIGMPVWRVSEPYLSQWLDDEPLGYQPALGPRISLALSHNQREEQTGGDGTTSSLGRKWSFSWLSYLAHDANTNNVVYLPGGGSITFTGASDLLTNTRLTGDSTNGFTLSFPDGSQYVYSQMVTNSSGVFQKAFLTEQWNSAGQKTKLEYHPYDPANPVVCLKDIVDGDGLLNTIEYVTGNSFGTNLIGKVTDRFSRSASFSYDNNGNLTSITDVAGLKSTFAYDSFGAVTNLATPYGTTSFKIVDHNSGVVAPNGRSIEITEPDGSKQLYLYTNSAPGVASSYATNQIPNTYPYSNTFETNSLDVRNTFHWGRLQYSNLSTNFLLTGDCCELF